MFRNTVSYVSCVHSNFPSLISYLSRFPPGQVEVFNLLPISAAPYTATEPSNCSSTIIELSPGPSQTIRVMLSHRRTAWQPSLLPLITVAGGWPDQEVVVGGKSLI